MRPTHADPRPLRPRTPARLQRGLVLALLGSLALHTLTVTPVVLLHYRALTSPPVAHTETDVELVASTAGAMRRDPEPSAATTASPEPSATAAPPTPSTPPPPTPTARTASRPDRAPRDEVADPEPTPSAAPTASRSPLHETAAANAVPVVRGDPSGVSAQRSRLPIAVRCRDAVAGLWRGHSFDSRRYNWHVFNLRVEREGDSLRGGITVRTWEGGPSQQRPPARCEGDLDYALRMNATGSITGEEISFGAQGSATVTSARCPTPGFVYNPDHFSGTVDTGRQEFQSFNNDGGDSVNAPVLFRRVGCLPGDELAAEPAPSTAP